MSEDPLVIIMVSNGPGEIATWVKPLAEQLHEQISMRPRVKKSPISLKLILVPCPNATGKEGIAAKKWILFEKIINKSRAHQN